jgi:hypothetical protein
LFGSRPDPTGTYWYASAGASAFLTDYAICMKLKSQTPVPTPALNPWGVGIMSILLSGSSVWLLRRRKRHSRT